MQTPTEQVYYNPFDRRCWKAIALGLPLLVAAIAGLAMVGWWAWGHTAATAPATWLRHSWIPAGLALLGAFTLALAAGLAWTFGLFAHAIGLPTVQAVKRLRMK